MGFSGNANSVTHHAQPANQPHTVSLALRIIHYMIKNVWQIVLRATFLSIRFVLNVILYVKNVHPNTYVQPVILDFL